MRTLQSWLPVFVAAALGCGATSQPASVPRTVSGALKTLYTKDDGSTQLVAGWALEMQGVTITGLLVPDSSAAGYTTFPITVAADGTFSVPNVPSGAYFIQTDQIIKVINSAAILRTLYRTTSDTPDLTLFVHGRADRTAGAGPLNLDVDGLTAFSDPAAVKFPSSQLRLTIGQASLFNLGVQGGLTQKPIPGSTSIDSSFRYGSFGGIWLPDASKGDVTYFYERSSAELGSGASAASYHYVSNYLRSTSLTMVDGDGGTLTGTMVAAPQTGSIQANLKLSQFAALARAVHPSAQPSATFNQSLTVFALPPAPGVLQSLNASAAPLALLNLAPQSAADVDYGALLYGRLPESTWTEFAQVSYTYDVALPTLTSGVTLPFTESYVKNVRLSPAPSSFAPVMSPPRSPRLGGNDALQPQASAGLEPVVSWSAPAAGTPASYQLQLYFTGGSLVDKDLAQLVVVGLQDTSFKVPQGALRAGLTYAGQISAQSGTAGTSLLQTSVEGETASADFGVFAP